MGVEGLVMRRWADRLVTKVTSAPMRMRRFANCRPGFMWPCAGKMTRRNRMVAVAVPVKAWGVGLMGDDKVGFL